MPNIKEVSIIVLYTSELQFVLGVGTFKEVFLNYSEYQMSVLSILHNSI
jgi:hypothetical protein